MLKKFMNLFIFSILCLSVAACTGMSPDKATPPEGDRKQAEDAGSKDTPNNLDAAALVIKQFEDTQSSVTYKDLSSFAKGDKYLTTEFAKKYHGEIRAGMEKFIKESKGTVTGSEPVITFRKQNGNERLYELEVDRTISMEQPQQSVTTYVQYLVTVTKQPDGSFLISNMEEK